MNDHLYILDDKKGMNSTVTSGITLDLIWSYKVSVIDAILFETFE